MTIANFESLAAYEPYFPPENWRGFSFTAEESQVLTDYRAGTGQYISEMQAQFITGQVPFTEWDNYVRTIRSGGYEQYLRVVTAAYERFIAAR
jgi:putative aldouronate transport system substrate-binding protein